MNSDNAIDSICDSIENGNPDTPGAWLYHSELPSTWARMMTVEYKNDKNGYWECPPGRANHGWDCSVYLWAAWDILAIKMRSNAPVVSQPPRQQSSYNPFTRGRQLFGSGA